MRSPFKLYSQGAVVAFCGRIFALGRWNLQMSWCKFPGDPHGQPPGMAADKCITKSSHHLSHDRASEGHGSIPCLISQTDLHRIKSL